MDFTSSEERPEIGDNPVVQMAGRLVRAAFAREEVSDEVWKSWLTGLIRNWFMREYDLFAAGDVLLRACVGRLKETIHALAKASIAQCPSPRVARERFSDADSLEWRADVVVSEALERDPKLCERMRAALAVCEKPVVDFMRGVPPFQRAVYRRLWFLRQVVERLFWTQVVCAPCENLRQPSGEGRWTYSFDFDASAAFKKASRASDVYACCLELRGADDGSFECAFQEARHGFSVVRDLCAWMGLHVDDVVQSSFDTLRSVVRLMWVTHSDEAAGPFPEDALDPLVKGLTPALLRGEDPLDFSDFAELAPRARCAALEIFVMREASCPHGFIYLANAYRRAGCADLMEIVAREALASSHWSPEARRLLEDAFPEFVPLGLRWPKDEGAERQNQESNGE